MELDTNFDDMLSDMGEEQPAVTTPMDEFEPKGLQATIPDEVPTREDDTDPKKMESADIGVAETFAKSAFKSVLDIGDGLYNMFKRSEGNKYEAIAGVLNTLGMTSDEEYAKEIATISKVVDSDDGIPVAKAIETFGFKPTITKKGLQKDISDSDHEIAKFLGMVAGSVATPAGSLYKGLSIGKSALLGGAETFTQTLGEENDALTATLTGSLATMLGGATLYTGRAGYRTVVNLLAENKNALNRVIRQLDTEAHQTALDKVAYTNGKEKFAKKLGFDKWDKVPDFYKLTYTASKSGTGKEFLREMAMNGDSRKVLAQAEELNSQYLANILKKIDPLNGLTPKTVLDKDGKRMAVDGQSVNKLNAILDKPKDTINQAWKVITNLSNGEVNAITADLARGIDKARLKGLGEQSFGKSLPPINPSIAIGKLEGMLDKIANSGNTFKGEHPKVYGAIMDALEETVNGITDKLSPKVKTDLTGGRFNELYSKVNQKLNDDLEKGAISPETVDKAKDVLSDFIDDLTGTRLGSTYRELNRATARLHNIYNARGIGSLKGVADQLNPRQISNVLSELGILSEPKQYKQFMGMLDKGDRSLVEMAVIKNAMLNKTIIENGMVKPAKAGYSIKGLDKLTFNPVTKEGKSLLSHLKVVGEAVKGVSDSLNYGVQEQYMATGKREVSMQLTGGFYRMLYNFLPDKHLIQHPSTVPTTLDKLSKVFRDKVPTMDKPVIIDAKDTPLTNSIVNSVNTAIHILEPFKDELGALPAPVSEDIMRTGGKNIPYMELTPSIREQANATMNNIADSLNIAQLSNMAEGVSQYNKQMPDSFNGIKTVMFQDTNGILHNRITSKLNSNLVNVSLGNVANDNDTARLLSSGEIVGALKPFLMKSKTLGLHWTDKNALGGKDILPHKLDGKEGQLKFNILNSHFGEPFIQEQDGNLIINIGAEGIKKGGVIDRGALIERVNTHLNNMLNDIVDRENPYLTLKNFSPAVGLTYR